MGQPSPEVVLQRAFDLGLLNERQMREVWNSIIGRNVSVDDLFHILVRREYLTNYQVSRLLKEDRESFFFGKYKVLYLVGTGTFAHVYRAVHQQTNQVVAIKRLRARFCDDPAQYNQFLREGRVGITLRHPNIVPIFDVVSEGKSHYLVMEFVEGRTLSEFVRICKKIEPLEATRLMCEITDALRYAFEAGVTHRDLKMSNVLVSSTGQAKLVDFGMAAIDESMMDGAADIVPGTRTIDYAALERATGVHKHDPRSDLYFLGCIYYHMLTGMPPFPESSDRMARQSRSRFNEVVPIGKLDPTISDSVVLVVNKAMKLDPQKRYQTPSAMLADLEIALRQIPLENAPSKIAVSEAQLAAAMPAATHSVMLVEPNSQLQEIMRNGLRHAGYRVLLTADPARAVKSFRQDFLIAECVVFNALDAGQAALDSFNEMGRDRRTGFIPAVLLLDHKHWELHKDAYTTANRVVVATPISMQQLVDTLNRLVAVPAKK
jgi:eukaryotic-like serine/threonine-protein kinase